MQAWEYEDKVWKIEGIVIILRCDPKKEVGDYPYIRAVAGGTTLAEWFKGRLASLQVPYVVHDGDVVQPHGKTKISKIRESYGKG